MKMNSIYVDTEIMGVAKWSGCCALYVLNEQCDMPNVKLDKTILLKQKASEGELYPP